MKNKVLTLIGSRIFYSKKGCNSCMDCKHLVHIRGKYMCKEYPRKTSVATWKFPYDNTTCKMFEEKSDEQ